MASATTGFLASPQELVRAHMGSRRALPIISLTDAQLGMGASFGNSTIWINTKGPGAVERVFSNLLAQSLIGTISLRYASSGLPLSIAQRTDPSAQGYVALRPDGGSRRLKIGKLPEYYW